MLNKVLFSRGNLDKYSVEFYTHANYKLNFRMRAIVYSTIRLRMVNSLSFTFIISHRYNETYKMRKKYRFKSTSRFIFENTSSVVYDARYQNIILGCRRRFGFFQIILRRVHKCFNLMHSTSFNITWKCHQSAEISLMKRRTIYEGGLYIKFLYYSFAKVAKWKFTSFLSKVLYTLSFFVTSFFL